MSRSYRKTPISGITTAKSDKPFKKLSHKLFRLANKQRLKSNRNLLYKEKEILNPYFSDKDGKCYIGFENKKWLRK